MRRPLGILAIGGLLAVTACGGGSQAAIAGASTSGAGGEAGAPGTGGSGGAGEAGSGGAGGSEAAETLLDVPYVDGAGPEQRLDLYAPAGPAGAKRPVVVWVHGGAWAIGDKGNGMSTKVPYFTGLGYVLVSANYRLSPEPVASPAPDRVKYPIHEQDVASALAWVHEHAGEHGGDPERVAILGHSAGAHLVALVATAPAFLQAHGLPLGFVRCVGSFDTEGYDIPTTMASATAQQATIYVNAFGDDPAVWQEASPLAHVAPNAGIGAFLVVRRGDAQRKAGQTAFRDALAAAGVQASLLDAAPLSHEEVNDHIGQPGDSIMTPPITEFLAGCFG